MATVGFRHFLLLCWLTVGTVHSFLPITTVVRNYDRSYKFPVARAIQKDDPMTSTPQRSDEEDDGWGTTADASSSFVSSTTENKKEPIATTNNTTDGDLFIPIVTLISIAGFVGLYAYETLRLYQAGELYLPSF